MKSAFAFFCRRKVCVMITLNDYLYSGDTVFKILHQYAYDLGNIYASLNGSDTDGKKTVISCPDIIKEDKPMKYIKPLRIGRECCDLLQIFFAALIGLRSTVLFLRSSSYVPFSLSCVFSAQIYSFLRSRSHLSDILR